MAEQVTSEALTLAEVRERLAGCRIQTAAGFVPVEEWTPYGAEPEGQGGAIWRGRIEERGGLGVCVVDVVPPQAWAWGAWPVQGEVPAEALTDCDHRATEPDADGWEVCIDCGDTRERIA